MFWYRKVLDKENKNYNDNDVNNKQRYSALHLLYVRGLEYNLRQL